MSEQSHLERLTTCRSGGVAVTFALLLIPLLLAMAVAVDYSRLLQIRTRMNDAADAAALVAVSPAVIDPSLTDAGQQSKSSAAASKVFSARVPSDVTVTGLTVTLTRSGAAYTAEVTYTATTDNLFGKLLQSTSQIAGRAASTYAAAYIDIHVLVDVSQSMGLGADPTTQAAMASDSRVGTCAFACHGNPGTPDMVTAAHSAGYKLRIDVVKDALARVIADTRTAAATTKATIRIALYSFDTQFRTLVPLTTDYAGLTTAASALDITRWGAGSSPRWALSQLAAQIGTPGNGVTASTPLAFVMFMTDGVANPTDNKSTGEWTYASTAYPAFDGKQCWPGQTPPPDAGPWYAPTGAPQAMPCVPDSWTPHHVGNGQMELQPLDSSWCQAVKSTGARLMTLYTRYDLTPAASTSSSNWWTNDWRLPLMQNTLMPKIASAMTRCATSSVDAWVGGDKATIDAAMKSMFANAVAAASRITR